MLSKFTNGTTDFFKYVFIVFFVVSAVSACVTAEDEAFYKSSMMMAQKGQKEQAYANMQRLCTKFPGDKRFCAEVKTLAGEIYSENMKVVKSKLDVKSPVPRADLKEAEKRLNKASQYKKSSEISKYQAKLREYKSDTEKAIAVAKTNASTAAENKDFYTAYVSVANAKKLAPEEFGPLVNKYGYSAIQFYMPIAEKLIAEDNLKDAKNVLNKMAVIDPGNTKVKQYQTVVDSNDNAEYYLAKGEEAREAGEFDRAMSYFKRALAFPDARQQAQKAIDNTRVQVVEVSFLKGVEFADQELNKQAYDSFIEAFSTMKNLPLELRTMVAIPKDELEVYYDNMYFNGQKAMDESAFGQSYLYFKMLSDLSPSYHGLREIKKSVEDKVLARALKSIAVIPFKSPASEPELGLQVTSNIMQILQKSLSKDVKIIERGALEILLREYELAVAGNVGEEQSEADAFKIKSADYLLMGEVLDSRTETNIQNSKKKVRVKVDEEKIRNIEWEDWSKERARALAAKRAFYRPEPARYTMKPIYDYAEYDVAFHEKVSYLSISYRVVETSQGRITYSNTVRSKKEARDDATSGIDLGSYKVEMKSAKLPTDIELSNSVRKESIDNISGQVKDLFKDQDEKYLAEAVKLESTNNLQEAVEMYVNSILLKIKKGKDVAELEDKAGKYLDVLSLY